MQTTGVIDDLPKTEEEMGTPALSPVTMLQPHIMPRTRNRVLLVGATPEALLYDGIASEITEIGTISQIPSLIANQDDVGLFDCIIMSPMRWSYGVFCRTLSLINRLLNDTGYITILTHAQNNLVFSTKKLDQALTDNNLMRYRSGPVALGMESCHHWVLVAVKSSYNPVSHARKMASQGRPDIAIEILDGIPQEITNNKALLIDLTLEKQRYYNTWMKSASANEPCHALFSKERREFAQVTALDPTNENTYLIHAQTWAHIGRIDMARRVLRSIQDKEKNGTSPESNHPCRSLPDIVDDHDSPLWNPQWRPPRILIITHEFSDYGMDTLYHGLCTLLGKEHIIEYPWKPTLHGQCAESANNYPCVFNYPDEPETLDRLETKLRNGEIDLILYADVVQMSHVEAVRRLTGANPQIPVILYDTWDDCFTPVPKVLNYVNRKKFDLIFKREMLAGVAYDPGTFPLPFGYPEQMTRAYSYDMKTNPFFWAGKSEYGLRPLYIDSLEKRLGTSLDQRYDQEAYQKKLRESRLGLSFFGCGFDTVRYWELPANGVMLLSERPPIRIPHNFKDGVSAVFFDDLHEMNDKLNYYTRFPEKTKKIAAAGHAHYLKHHTNLCRARQMLGIVQRELGSFSSQSPVLRPQTVSKCQSQKEASTAYLGLVKGENYGWGVCSKYLIQELPRWRPVHVINDQDGTASNQHLKGPLFQALTTVDFEPLFESARGTRNVAYTFFENELSKQSNENAKLYDLILTGSNWCRDRMLEKGISNCDVLIQGIDPNRFYPINVKKPDDRFVIFSGGKFELRKGQDLVLKAVQVLQEKYSDIFLVNCWYNLWPKSLKQMATSPHINFSYRHGESWSNTMQRIYAENDLDASRIATLDLVPHHQLRSLYAQTDIGVFPNRCEGGTNLVLMEYMACAKPIIASDTSGHKDILTDENALLLRQMKNINILNNDGSLAGRWQDPSLDELVATLEHAYHHRDSTRQMANRAGKDLQQFTWANCARRLSRFLARG